MFQFKETSKISSFIFKKNPKKMKKIKEKLISVKKGKKNYD